MAVAGDTAYVAYRQLRVISVADPAAPAEVGFCDTPGYPLEVAVAGNYAYVADGSGGLRVINVANPAAPVEVGFYEIPGNTRSVAVAGRYVYVTGDAGLFILRHTGGADRHVYLPLIRR